MHLRFGGKGFVSGFVRPRQERAVEREGTSAVIESEEGVIRSDGHFAIGEFVFGNVPIEGRAGLNGRNENVGLIDAGFNFGFRIGGEEFFVISGASGEGFRDS
jgi:hypothetical protein